MIFADRPNWIAVVNIKSLAKVVGDIQNHFSKLETTATNRAALLVAGTIPMTVTGTLDSAITTSALPNGVVGTTGERKSGEWPA